MAGDNDDETISNSSTDIPLGEARSPESSRLSIVISRMLRSTPLSSPASSTASLQADRRKPTLLQRVRGIANRPSSNAETDIIYSSADTNQVNSPDGESVYGFGDTNEGRGRFSFGSRGRRRSGLMILGISFCGALLLGLIVMSIILFVSPISKSESAESPQHNGSASGFSEGYIASIISEAERSLGTEKFLLACDDTREGDVKVTSSKYDTWFACSLRYSIDNATSTGLVMKYPIVQIVLNSGKDSLAIIPFDGFSTCLGSLRSSLFGDDVFYVLYQASFVDRVCPQPMNSLVVINLRNSSVSFRLNALFSDGEDDTIVLVDSSTGERIVNEYFVPIIVESSTARKLSTSGFYFLRKLDAIASRIAFQAVNSSENFLSIDKFQTWKMHTGLSLECIFELSADDLKSGNVALSLDLSQLDNLEFVFPSPSPSMTPSIAPIPIPTNFPSQSSLISTALPVKSPTQKPSGSRTSFPTMEPMTSSPSLSRSDFKKQFFGSKPNILFLLMDDFGNADVAFTHDDARDKIVQATPFISNLARKEGVILRRHYAHWHCSPSRRAFISGRLTVHTGEDLSIFGDDHLDLRFPWISEKLKSAGYRNYFLGKSHLGYKSAYHHPQNRGFDSFIGIIEGINDYEDFGYWDEFSGNATEKTLYATSFYANEAINVIKGHGEGGITDPFFIFLNFQTPHTPIQPPPVKDPRYNDFTSQRRHPYEYMIYAADYDFQQVIETLKAQGLWNNTFVLFSSDNGATEQKLRPVDSLFDLWDNGSRGSNYPFRGEKKTAFEGGFRVPTFISGGVVPKANLGKQSGLISHISDWFSSFCYLAGVEPESPDAISTDDFFKTRGIQIDNRQSMDEYDARNPVEVGVSNPTNLWGSDFPEIDSINILPYLLDAKGAYLAPFVDLSYGFHPSERKDKKLVLSTEAMIFENYKFIAAQPCSYLHATEDCKDFERLGWMEVDATTYTPFYEDTTSRTGCYKLNVPYMKNIQYEPCVFDLSTDAREQRPIKDADLINRLWFEFNKTMLTQYTTNLKDKSTGLTPVDLAGLSSEYCSPMNITIQREQLQLFGVLESPFCNLDKCSVENRKVTCTSLDELRKKF